MSLIGPKWVHLRQVVGECKYTCMYCNDPKFSDKGCPLCERTTKALARLHKCVGSPEPSMFAYVISILFTFNIFLQDTRAQWSIVFYIAAGVYFSGALIYTIFSRGTEQQWNNPVKGLSFAHKENRPEQAQYREINGPYSGTDSSVDG